MEQFVGRPLKRIEDPHLLTGRGLYVYDVCLPNALYAVFVRSQYAHAKIKRIDTKKASRMGGVVNILTSTDVIENHVNPMRASLYSESVKEDKHSPYTENFPLAIDKVRHVGDRVALVVADSLYTAEDAAELVDVEYEPLPAIIDAKKSLESPPALIYDEWGDNLIFSANFSGGDYEKVAKESYDTVRETFSIGRISGSPIETKCCAAEFNKSTGLLTVWASGQRPSVLRTTIAQCLSIPENKIRVVIPDVGGSFGVKGQIMPEEIAICLASIKLGRPIKWMEDRSEHLSSGPHSKECIVDVEAALESDGIITGLKAKIISDAGAYSIYPMSAMLEPNGMALRLTGPYDIRNYTCQIYVVATNKSPKGPYRGVGEPNETFIMNRIIAIIARKLGMDVADVMRKNLITAQQMPYRNVTGLLYDSGDYHKVLEKALDLIGYKEVISQQASLRREGRLIGVGIGNYLEMGAISTKLYQKRGLRTIAAGLESVRITIDPSGKVALFTALCSQGQGHQTTLAQVLADELHVDINDVEIFEGDTSTAPYGMGTFASRSIVLGAGVIMKAAKELREKLLRIAAHVLSTDVQNLEFENGRICYIGNKNRSLTFEQIARVAYVTLSDLPPGMQPGLDVTCYVDVSLDACFSNGCHAAVVEIDKETGGVTILKYVAVDDCGKVVNPVIKEGQTLGGILQGIGQALLEELVYDDNGQLLTSSLMDYALPTSMDMPPTQLDYFETPSPFTPNGIKVGGEGGAIAPPAAIVNAISDAIRTEINEIPINPEKLLMMMKQSAQQ